MNYCCSKYYIYFICFLRIAEYERAVEYVEARREQEPLQFNANRAMEQPIPNDELHEDDFAENEEVLIDAFAVGRNADESDESDPLGDVKSDLELFVINEGDRMELERMLAEENTNVVSAVYAETSIAVGTENMDAVHSNQSGESANENSQNAADASVPIAEPESAIQRDARNGDHSEPEEAHAVEGHSSIATSIARPEKTSAEICSFAGESSRNAIVLAANALTPIADPQNHDDVEAINSAISDCSQFDDDLIFEDGDMPMPKQDFRHDLVKHEDDDLSADLCYKIVVS